MVKYGDLRDFHNKKFFIKRLDEAIITSAPILSILPLAIINKEFVFSSCLSFVNFMFYYNQFNKYLNKEINGINKEEINNLHVCSYNKILLNTCQFLDKFGISDPIEICLTLSYLIGKGYFSLNKKFKVQNKSFHYSLNFGHDIMRGYGVCRSLAQFTTDVLNIMGYETYDFFVENVKAGEKGNNDINHVISMIVYGKKLIFADLAQQQFYYKKGDILVGTKGICVPFFFIDSSDKFKLFISNYYRNKRNVGDIVKIVNYYSLFESYNYSFKPNEIRHRDAKMLYKKNKKLYKNMNELY